MLAMKLVRLIEAHSEELSRGLAIRLSTSDRTSEYRKIPPEELRPAATDVYRNLGEWLLQKPEAEIAARFRAVAAHRVAEGIPRHQYVWALMLSRDHLWQFLRLQCFLDTIFELHAQLELLQLLNQFFDRAIYYAVLGYDEALQQSTERSNLARARDLAISVGLMSGETPNARPEPLQDSSPS